MIQIATNRVYDLYHNKDEMKWDGMEWNEMD